MNSESEFITRLIGFGLAEKKAQCYFYLLKYGPKTPSPLAKALQTYNEDVRRTLRSLVDKGMVLTSHDSPTIYASVELETALDSALKKHESELREMEARKLGLEELARQQHFRPSDEISTFQVLKTAKEIAAAAVPVILHAEEEFLWVAPQHALVFASMFGINTIVKELIERGGYARGITDVAYSSIPLVQEVLDIGEEVRHFEGYNGIYYGQFDRRYSISAINIDVTHITTNTEATMLYTDDPVYATYLASTFEVLWQHATPAEDRIQELLEQGSPQAD